MVVLRNTVYAATLTVDVNGRDTIEKSILVVKDAVKPSGFEWCIWLAAGMALERQLELKSIFTHWSASDSHFALSCALRAFSTCQAAASAAVDSTSSKAVTE